jgi:hypothetical protein
MIKTHGLQKLLVVITVATSAVMPATPAPASTVSHSPAALSAVTAGPPRPDLRGTRVQSPGRPQIYIIDPEGYRRWIPNPSTYDNLFKTWDGVIVDLGTHDIPERAALSNGAFLAKSPDAVQVYLISNGQKRWITSPPVFDHYRFNWTKIQTMPSAALDAIPTGPSWS